MSRWLAYTGPMQGHLFPIVPILEELRQRGHEVALRTLDSEQERMQALGFETAPIDAAIEARRLDDWRARTQAGATRNTMRTFCDRAPLDAADLRRAIEEERPDALFVDVLAWGALCGAEAWGGPWAAFSPFPLYLPSRDAPPTGLGLAPARNRLERTRDMTLGSVSQLILDGLIRSRINELRRELGVAALRHATDLFLCPPLLLHLTAEPFEFPRSDWPENIAMVGPCDWDPPGELPAEILAAREPLVLVTTSSDFQDDTELVRVALEALAEEPVHVVATVPAAALDDLRQPANASVVRFAPHGAVLDRAVCAVTHGGMGTTQKALSRGVPVCAVPYGRDQPDVARRIEVAGAGTHLPSGRLTAERLRGKVREAISMRPGAEKIASAFAAAGGAPAAADALERQLGA